MKFVLTVLKISLFCTFFAAANYEIAARDEWRRIQSKNFQLVGNAGEKDLRRVATKLEQFRHVFTQLFPKMKFTSPIPTRVVVFKDEKYFKSFKSIEWAAGYFQPGDDINYIVLTTEGEKEDTFRTIFHEYTHFLMDNSFGRSKIPPWFNEGIAEYYEQFLIENDQKVTLGAINYNHLSRLQQFGTIPFESFFATDYYTLHKQTKQSAQLFYAQAWFLTHYLLQGGDGSRRAQLDKFIDLLIAGSKPKDAFQQAFQTDFAAMEAELKKYAAQKTYTGTVIPFKEKLIFDNQMETFPVGIIESKAYQGDLLYHIRRYPEAEAILTETLTLDADSSLANTALGLVKMRQKKFAEAKILLEKAIAADSRNYFAYFNYAFAISREEMTEFGFASGYTAANAEKIRENVRKAISLNPDYAESYNLFAFVSVVRNEQLDEAVEMIEKALKIAPGNQWYAMRLAELQMRKQNFGAARNLANKILQTASDDRLKLYAENTVRTINSLEAQLSGIRDYVVREVPETVTDAPLSEEEIARRREKAMLESLNETLRKPRTDEKRLLGYVTKIECQSGQTVFSVKADEQIRLFNAVSLETVRLVSFETELVNAEFGCGAPKKEILAVITFRPAGGATSTIAGEIVSIEFVPKTFKFLTEVK